MKISQPKITNIIQVMLHVHNHSLQLAADTKWGSWSEDKHKYHHQSDVSCQCSATRMEGKKTKIPLEPYELMLFQEKVIKALQVF